MADENQLKLIQQSVVGWNKWRKENPTVQVDLSKANLKGVSLHGANLSEANLCGANLRKANLRGADLIKAKLTGAKLYGADLRKADFREAILLQVNFHIANLRGADLSKAKLKGAKLRGANCYKVNLSEADLTGANLQNVSLVETNLEKAVLTNCKIFGISAWALKGKPANQTSLVITPDGETEITVDDLQVAQFVYLLLNNQNVRNVIDTLTSKAVLILGRFTPERKNILTGLADELRNHNIIPIIFDFERSPSRDFTETIKVLAGLSLFIIADITNPRAASLELQAIVPDYKIPILTIIQKKEKPFSMFSDLENYDWVLRPVAYTSIHDLVAGFKPAILDRVWKMHQKIQKRKAQETKVLSMDDFLRKSD